MRVQPVACAPRTFASKSSEKATVPEPASTMPAPPAPLELAALDALLEPLELAALDALLDALVLPALVALLEALVLPALLVLLGPAPPALALLVAVALLVSVDAPVALLKPVVDVPPEPPRPEPPTVAGSLPRAHAPRSARLATQPKDDHTIRL